MEIISTHTMEFSNFNKTLPPLSFTAPSSPRGFSPFFFSAPTSPRHLSEFYNEFDAFTNTTMSLGVPFDWEETPGTPKSPKDEDFVFDIGCESETASVFAEELFDGGKIRPLKPPPGFEEQEKNILSPSFSPIYKGKRIIRDAFSPRKQKLNDPFETAIQNTRSGIETERGRGKDLKSHHGHTRSLSPFRVSAYPWDDQDKPQEKNVEPESLSIKPKTNSFPSSKVSSSKKWRLKNLFLFRSTSEGRGTDQKDPFRKYFSFFRKHEDVKNSSVRSTESSGSRKGQVSAHELHYTLNRQASNDLKKKSFLPYKHGILG